LNINIIYCPTDRIVTDYFTKPLQGSLFRKLRDARMGVTHPSSLLTEEPPPTKERVEKIIVLPVIRNNSNNEHIAGGGLKSNTVPNPSYANVIKFRGG